MSILFDLLKEVCKIILNPFALKTLWENFRSYNAEFDKLKIKDDIIFKAFIIHYFFKISDSGSHQKVELINFKKSFTQKSSLKQVNFSQKFNFDTNSKRIIETLFVAKNMYITKTNQFRCSIAIKHINSELKNELNPFKTISSSIDKKIVLLILLNNFLFFLMIIKHKYLTQLT